MKINLNKRSIDISYLILVSVLLFLFYKSFYNSFIVSIKTGTWRLFLIPFVLVVVKEEAVNVFKFSKSKGDIIISSFLVFAGLLSQYLARWAGLNIFYDFSLILLIFSLVVFFAGYRGILNFKWSLFYLVFMTSVTDELILPFQIILRNLATNVLVLILPLIGYPVISDGTNIRLANIVINVAAECSGINQLISLMVISIPLSIIILKSTILRAFAIVASIPLAIFSNILRLIVIVLWNYNRTEFSHGPHGLFAMSSIFVIGLLLLILINLIFQKIEKLFIMAGNNTNKKTSGEKVEIKENGYTAFIFIMITLLISSFFFFRKPITDNTCLNKSLDIILNSGNSFKKGYQLKIFSDTLLPQECRFSTVMIDTLGNEILLEINNYKYQDSEKGLEITTYSVLRFLYDAKINYLSNQISYAFGQYSIDGKIENRRATAVLYHVNNKFFGKRSIVKMEIIKQLLLEQRNRGALIAITLIKKGNEVKNDSEIMERFISELYR